jgi:hypothetical protein
MSSEEKKPRYDHERSDWDLRYVVWGSIVLVVSVTLILAVSWWIFREFDRWAAGRQMGTVRTTARENIPPEPRLQVSPQGDWTEMLEREQAILGSYRWVDRSQRIVHIPIQRAMELLAERGLPVEGGQK